MDIHKNALLTVYSRGWLVRRILECGETPKAVATAFGVSTKTARKWVARFQAEGPDGLRDRSSRPHKLRQETSRTAQDLIVALRRQRLTASRSPATSASRRPPSAASSSAPGSAGCATSTPPRRCAATSATTRAS
jgi:hypothetical protein